MLTRKRKNREFNLHFNESNKVLDAIHDVPPEIWIWIIPYLTINETRLLSYTQTSLRELIRDNDLLAFRLNRVFSHRYYKNSQTIREDLRFGKIHKIYFHGADFLVDLEPLRGISEVILERCHNVVDLSPLADSR